MKEFSISHNLILFLITSIIANPSLAHDKQNGTILKQNSGISFTENKGQVHDQNYKPKPDVLYGVTAGNMAVHIKKTGVSYQLYSLEKYHETEETKIKGTDLSLSNGKRKRIDKQTHSKSTDLAIYRIDLKWLNCNKNFTTTQDEALQGYTNYYLKSCPKGALNVKSYKGITLHNLYAGIDLHYYEKNGQLKHDYIVVPHADYQQIQILIEGADIEIMEDGSLMLSTPLGKVQEGAPIVFQNGKQLKAKWVIKNASTSQSIHNATSHTLNFEIENHDPNYELVIDPVTRLWGTYTGSSGDDNGYDVATDSTGNVYFSGSTTSGTSTLIATSGSHQSSYAGSSDAFLSKFDGTGARLWSTYFGDSQTEYGTSCAADYLGNIYLAGLTASNGTILATPGSHQSAFGGGSSDAFLSKFDANGVRLWSTYYGGNSNDDAGESGGCITDQAGNVYIVGTTSSNNATTMASPGSHQPLFGGGNADAYLAKFSSAGIRLWATYYGGSNDEAGSSCAIDPSGNVFLGGDCYLSSGTVVATVGSHQPSFGGSQDLFLVKFNNNGIRQWGTYYGGLPVENGGACVADALGNVYLCGNTQGNSSAIATPGAHQTSSGGGSNGFLVKLNANGVRQWGTFYGGSGAESISACTVDKYNNIFITGSTLGSSTVIATPFTHQPFSGGGFDGYLVKFNTGGSRLWGTYYGGLGFEGAYSCITDTMDNIYICGSTQTTIGINVATSNGFQATYGGGTFDGYLAKFYVCNAPPPQPISISGPSVTCAGSVCAFSTPTLIGVYSYTWSTPGSWTGTTSANVISVTPNSSGNITVVHGNGCGVSQPQSLFITVNPQPLVIVNSGSICIGDSFTLTPTGANTYTYSGGPVVNPLTTTSYSVTGTGTNGCVSSNTAIAVIHVNPLPNVNAFSNMTVLCVGEQATITASGAANYTFNPGGISSSITISPSVTTSYTLIGLSENGCMNTAVVTQSVAECTGITNEELKTINSGILIYPNPSSGVLNLEMTSDNDVILVNAIGQIVYSVKLTSGKHQINFEHLAKGIYMLKILNNKDSKAIKLIRE